MRSCALKVGVSVSGCNGVNLKPKASQPLASSLQLHDPALTEFGTLNSKFFGESLVVPPDQKRLDLWNPRNPASSSFQAQATYYTSKAMRWWEKSLKPNMTEIHSAQQLVDELRNAGDRLVIVDFYSPGCGGCKSLFPKICQLAESNPDAIFLTVNHEKLNPMCHALHIRVLPFFRFYRGAEGRVASFSCTISTISKFKNALAKHSTERCSLGAAKGLDESELLRLSTVGELSQDLFRFSSMEEGKSGDLVLENLEENCSPSLSYALEAKQENNVMLLVAKQ